ncbi:FeoA domain-containing protein [Campylobacter sp. US33a]|uniref:FeoA domain-containing protein n=1 Tax=Campylobacter sp. CCS1377 TaxID=3158229 RepID=A0AAU7E7R9_9BACT|nr:FeoA domain-containing protein [Campylobacter sp. US33a]MCW1359700.1 FeoA domain-containing protein [Campylobacter jejuni]TEY04522.1 hypothetical protein ELQ16_00395 [Campylobacter sp. US33a]
MTLDVLKDDEVALIIDIDASDELKNRFFSFGFIKGRKIKKISSSLRKSTLMVELENSCVILRANEAKTIKIQKITQ